MHNINAKAVVVSTTAARLCVRSAETTVDFTAEDYEVLDSGSLLITRWLYIDNTLVEWEADGFLAE